MLKKIHKKMLGPKTITDVGCIKPTPRIPARFQGRQLVAVSKCVKLEHSCPRGMSCGQADSQGTRNSLEFIRMTNIISHTIGSCRFLATIPVLPLIVGVTSHVCIQVSDTTLFLSLSFQEVRLEHLILLRHC